MMTDPRSGLSRREVAIRGIAAALVTVVGAPALGQRAGSMTIYRDAGCGCCLNWVAHARRAGFATRVIDSPDMTTIKRRLGVPVALWACHTAITSGLVVEGHVPLDRVTALLQRRPANVRGVAVPGMPLGSPGMESPDGRRQPFQILLFDASGRTRAI